MELIMLTVLLEYVIDVAGVWWCNWNVEWSSQWVGSISSKQGGRGDEDASAVSTSGTLNSTQSLGYLLIYSVLSRGYTGNKISFAKLFIVLFYM